MKKVIFGAVLALVGTIGNVGILLATVDGRGEYTVPESFTGVSLLAWFCIFAGLIICGVEAFRKK